MAAFAPLHAAEWLQFVSVPPQYPHSYKWGGKLHGFSASLTFTGAGTGTAKMFRLPAGKLRIFPDQSRVVCPVGTATADLHIGYASYVNEAGTTVAASANAFADNLDVGGGALDQAWPLPAVGYLDVHSQRGIDIEVLIDTANSPAAGELFLLCVFQRG